MVIALLVAGEVIGAHSRQATPPAPALPTTTLRRPAVSLASLRGKPAIVSFWASWCGPCHEDAPALGRAARRLAGRARVVAVDWDDRASAARAFIRHYGWRFSVLADSTGVVGERYGVGSLPTTYILNPRGDVVETLRGPQSAAVLEREALRAR